MSTDDRMQLFHRLRTVSMHLEHGRQDFARREGLHPTDLYAMVALLDADRAGTPATPGWLGRTLGLNSAGVTKLLDRLEAGGMVSRSADPTDRRRTLLRVTPAAMTTGTAYFGPVIERTTEAMQSFSRAELAVVSRFLAAVIATTDPAAVRGE